MEDRELMLMMKSLVGKAENENNTTTGGGGWAAEQAEAAYNAMWSSTTRSATPLDDRSSSSLMPLPFSQFTQDTHINTYPTITTATSDCFPSQNPIFRLPNYHECFPLPTTTTNPFYNNPPDLNLEYITPTPPLPLHHLPPGYDSMNDYSSIFNHLPDLLPLDPSNCSYSVSYPSSSSKSPRLIDFYSSSASTATVTATQYLHPLPLFPTKYNPFLPSSSAASPSSSYASAAPPPPPPVKPRKRATPSPLGNSIARQRRQKLCDKLHCLRKLLPSDKKMDTATVFEEAYKYVKFLQAQLTVLRHMPVLTPATAASSSSNDGGGGDPPPDLHLHQNPYGGLERLSRNQLLQVLLNSAVAQNYMSSRRFCVFSVEQLEKLHHPTTTNLLLYHPHLFFDSHFLTN